MVWLFYFLLRTAILSIGLGLFNLVPIPPLDGSKILFSFLPERAYYTLMRYERFGMLLLLVIVWLDLGGSYLSNAIGVVYQRMAGYFSDIEVTGWTALSTSCRAWCTAGREWRTSRGPGSDPLPAGEK